MEFTFTCSACGHREAWSTEAAAQSASVWHIWHVHHDTWVALAGDRMPVDRMPEQLGRQLENWELQS